MNGTVYSGKPSQAPVEEYQALTGRPDREVVAINLKEMHWNLYEENVPKPKEPTAASPQPSPTSDEKVCFCSPTHLKFTLVRQSNTMEMYC
jgi:hypothetical protein